MMTTTMTTIGMTMTEMTTVDDEVFLSLTSYNQSLGLEQMLWIDRIILEF